MVNSIQDQADGLRRLVARDLSRFVTVAFGRRGVGRTSAVINLAAALAKNGKAVLVVDENIGANNLSGMLGLTARYDFLDIVRRDKTLEEVLLHHPSGISVLPAGHSMRSLSKLNSAEQAYLTNCFEQVVNSVHIVLMDAVPGSASKFMSLDISTHEVVVVVSSDARSITEAYALIKLLHRDHARQHIRILINKVANEVHAQAIFNNIAQVTQRYLGFSLDYMGFIPPDEKLNQSIQLHRPVVDAFPDAASAIGFLRAAEALIRLPYQKGDGGESGSFTQPLIQNDRFPDSTHGDKNYSPEANN